MLTQVELAEQAALDGDQDTIAAAETEIARLESELSNLSDRIPAGRSPTRSRPMSLPDR